MASRSRCRGFGALPCQGRGDLMSDFVEQCREEWKRLGVPDPLAEEMATDLASDLSEAEAEGVSTEDFLGSSSSIRVRSLLPGQPSEGSSPSRPSGEPSPPAVRPRSVHRPCSDRRDRFSAVARDRRAQGVARHVRTTDTPAAGVPPPSVKPPQTSATSPVVLILLLVASSRSALLHGCGRVGADREPAHPPPPSSHPYAALLGVAPASPAHATSDTP